MKIRPTVMQFAEAMEKKLRQHDEEKGGWEDCDFPFLFDKLEEEHDEVTNIIEKDFKNNRFPGELVDLANVCMMIWDKIKHSGKYDTWKNGRPITS